jgi:peroxiredoxin
VIARGSVAPDFALPNQVRETIRLSDYRGKVVVLAFHPLAFTPVCSAQMTTYERELPKLRALDAEVLSVSNDANPSKKAWADSLGGISYQLLSDHHPHGQVASAYGVLREDGLAERAIILIDRQGVVRWTRLYDMADQPRIDDLFAAIEALEPR